MNRYPLYRRLGGHHGRCGQVEKISHPPGLDSKTVQAVASRYTDLAIYAHDVAQDKKCKKYRFTPSLPLHVIEVNSNFHDPTFWPLGKVQGIQWVGGRVDSTGKVEVEKEKIPRRLAFQPRASSWLSVTQTLRIYTATVKWNLQA
jgi:hypothetical protein